MAAVPNRARPFVLFVCACGAFSLATGMFPWHATNDTLLFVSYVALTALASALSTVLPGLEGTVSVNFVFFLIGICTLTLSETLALALIATLVQVFGRKKRLHFVHFAFNLSQVALAITASYWAYDSLLAHSLHGRSPIALLVAAIVFFLLNSIPVATVVALTDGTAIYKRWIGYAWTFPYYLVGAAIAGVIQLLNRVAGWEVSILLLPAVYAVYRSFRTQLGRWEDEKRHLHDIADLNMRTIETLALAIEAKDHTTGDHLQRVRVYALELAKDLGLTADETEALKAASVLHDIGKLAVPEHIISKPGKLTPEEFEKMKVHPVVGAEILEQVRFPYPVAPIVRAHHEKWDGSGYPEGLSGEQIPIGARILSAVDCLDALASDRQYRPALPLDDAMAKVERDSGKAFDPRVVAALKARYVELEQLAKAQEPEPRPKLSTDIKVQRGAAPDAGFGVSATAENGKSAAEETYSAARNTDAALFLDTFRRLASETLTPEEMFSAAAVDLYRLVAYDAVAAFVGDDSLLTPRFVLGHGSRQLSALRIRRGKGLAGWVAETGQPIINGNPSVEPGFGSAVKTVPLRSALAVPVERGGSVIGVLSLYRREADAFGPEDLKMLQTASVQLAGAFAACLDKDRQSIPDFTSAVEPEFALAERARITRSATRK
jgi:putative nucleotidyltransferase with HDIG domain